MKKTLICLIAVSVLALGIVDGAAAQERAGRFDVGSGLGFNIGQGGNAAFYWQFGGDYYFNDMIAINPNFYISVDGAFIFGIVPRVRFTFDLPWDNFEAFADGGGGFIVGENSIKDYTFVFGGGGYYWLLDGQLGLGTDLDFAITGIAGARFRVLWSIASVLWRFQ